MAFTRLQLLEAKWYYIFKTSHLVFNLLLALYIPIEALFRLYRVSPNVPWQVPDPFLPGCKPHAAMYVLEIT